MRIQLDAPTAPSPSLDQDIPEASDPSPGQALREALRAAAETARAAGTSVEDFMRLAWQASAEARPSAHARLERKRLSEEDRALMKQLAELRKQGKLALA